MIFAISLVLQEEHAQGLHGAVLAEPRPDQRLQDPLQQPPGAARAPQGGEQDDPEGGSAQRSVEGRDRRRSSGPAVAAASVVTLFRKMKTLF